MSRRGQLRDQEVIDCAIERLSETSVRYILNVEKFLFVSEAVPTRVNRLTGEQSFAPAIVRRIQQIALSTQKPDRIVQAKVYDW